MLLADIYGSIGTSSPAAYDTLCALFRDTQTAPEDPLRRERSQRRRPAGADGALQRRGEPLHGGLLHLGRPRAELHLDARAVLLRATALSVLYDIDAQDMHCGGSGCGCSASVLCGYLLRGIREGKWQRIIFAPTGALLSPTTTFQGESIPGICHAVVLSNKKEG